jgi:adenylate cyclase
VRDGVGDDAGYQWTFAGLRHLKGIKGIVKLFRVRRGFADPLTRTAGDAGDAGDA